MADGYDYEKIYSMTPQIYSMIPQNNSLFEEEERPSEKITVSILLTSAKLNLKGLNTRLAPDNMEASRDKSRSNAIVVEGTPPQNGYGAQDVLRVVQRFDKGASIIY